MKFELNKSQLERLTKWQESIKEKYDQYGSYSFKFTPTGVGCIVVVKSELIGDFLDLTDVDSW